jgi:hypothetical protein
MKTEYSVSGKRYYKIVDEKKIRISKEEYDNKKIKVSKKRGGENINDVKWYIIFGRGGNLSPAVQDKINEKTNYVLSSKEYNLETLEGIKNAKTYIDALINENKSRGKGAVLFLSAQRDPNVFEHCRNDENFEIAKKAGKFNNEETLEKIREKLWYLNFVAPVEIYKAIKNKENMIFGYISSIYVFTGKKQGINRKELINDTNADFIQMDNNNDRDSLFASKGKELYAYSKRYVELKLYEETSSGGLFVGRNPLSNIAKIVVLRMDGITSENSSKRSDSTFLKTLADAKAPFDANNFTEVRYPVFSSEVADVLIAAVNSDIISTDNVPTRPANEANIKVFHIAGSQKEKGITKGEMIIEAIKNKIINLQDSHQFFTINRKMDSQNTSKLLESNIKNIDFYETLFETFKKALPETKGGSKSRRTRRPRA